MLIAEACLFGFPSVNKSVAADLRAWHRSGSLYLPPQLTTPAETGEERDAVTDE